MKLICSEYKSFLPMISLLLVVVILATGCIGANKTDEVSQEEIPDVAVEEKAEEVSNINVPTDIINESSEPTLVSYDVISIGRADPFMPAKEKVAYDKARSDAYAQANEYNNSLANLKKMKDVVIREPDDISPYSFNLPVPPTSLASDSSVAARITKTKVVGIMYNAKNPTAIINVDEKDYLVRQGDKIIGEEYKVLQINPSWITVGFGSNIYSASIGELFSKDEISKYQNDLYNLKNRFGGRKS